MASPRTHVAQGRHGGFIGSDFSREINCRERALVFRDRGYTQEETARVFGVSARTIARWETLRKTKGSLAPRRHLTGRKRNLTMSEIDKVRLLLTQNPTLTDAELAEMLGGKVSRRTMNEYVTELGFVPKVPAKGNEALTSHIITETREYLRQLKRVPQRVRCYVDETGLYANEHPRRVRAICGVRASIPLAARARRYTVYWAITSTGQLHSPILSKEI